MRLISKYLFLFFFLIGANVSLLAQSNGRQNCTPTTPVKGILCPDKQYCPCPPNAKCAQFVVTTDKTLTVIGFKLMLLNSGEEEIESHIYESNTNSFTPAMQAAIVKLNESHTLEFSCIKAKDKSGKEFVVQPFSIFFKDDN